jgi:hypothetical protein
LHEQNRFDLKIAENKNGGSRAFGAATQAVEMMEATQGGFNWLPPPDAAPTLSGALV